MVSKAKLLQINNKHTSRIFLVRSEANGTRVKLCLRPGANNIEPEELEKFAGGNNETFFNVGVLGVEDAPVPTLASFQDREPLSAVQERPALEAVAACGSLQQLERWAKQDGRLKIRDAIDARGVALKIAQAGD
jgi:hypothetical protein